jgi:uncharacterized repeat protein (TIGR02543 family)
VNGSDGLPGNQTLVVTPGDKYPALPNLTRPDHVFAGWKNADGLWVTPGVTTVDLNAINHTLYAQWSIKVDFYDDTTGTTQLNADDMLPGTKPLILVPGEKYPTLPSLTKTDMLFAGWVNQAGEKIVPGITVIPDKNHDLFAAWDVRVDFIVDDPSTTGVEHDNVGNRSVTPGGNYGGLGRPFPIPYKAGYTFEGWYTIDDVLVTSLSDVPANAKNHELYAKFKPIPPDVIIVTIFDDDGSLIAGPFIVYAQNGTYGQVPLVDPVRAGFKFNGYYYYDPDGNKIRVTNDSPIPSGIKDIRLYAEWSPINKGYLPPVVPILLPVPIPLPLIVPIPLIVNIHDCDTVPGKPEPPTTQPTVDDPGDLGNVEVKTGERLNVLPFALLGLSLSAVILIAKHRKDEED